MRGGNSSRTHPMADPRDPYEDSDKNLLNYIDEEEEDGYKDGYDIYDEDDPDEYSYPHRVMRKCMRYIRRNMTRESIIGYLDWFTNTAALNFNVSFEHILGMMAIFVLFGKYIKTLAGRVLGLRFIFQSYQK
jgi:hypothetical protein